MQYERPGWIATVTLVFLALALVVPALAAQGPANVPGAPDSRTVAAQEAAADCCVLLRDHGDQVETPELACLVQSCFPPTRPTAKPPQGRGLGSVARLHPVGV